MPALKVVTSFGFDGCGNLSSVRTVGSNPNGTAMPARTASFDYGSRCQMLESATNAAAEKTTYAWRYEFGVPTRVTDPNGLSTTWMHDEFGRRATESASDGTRRSWNFQSCGTTGCWGTGNLRFLVYDRSYAANGALIREHHSYYDAYERPRLEEYHGALGTWLHQTYDYDAAGRQVRESRPYASVPNGHTIRTFDPLGRTLSQRDYDGGGATVRNSSLAYAGRTTLLTDSLGRTRSSITDVAGKMRRVTDPSPGGTTRYDYDSLGNLNRIQDAIGAVSTGTYDARGFRTQWSDADAGTWTFAHNSLGEVVAWTDANGRSFAAAYDALGRKVSRTEPEGTSTWTWGSSAAARNVGRLQSKAGLGYAEVAHLRRPRPHQHAHDHDGPELPVRLHVQLDRRDRHADLSVESGAIRSIGQSAQAALLVQLRRASRRSTTSRWRRHARSGNSTRSAISMRRRRNRWRAMPSRERRAMTRRPSD